MNTKPTDRPSRDTHFVWSVPLAAVLVSLVPYATTAQTTVFFDSSQVATLVATNTTSETISSEGYLFTYTRDKLFTGGVGLTNPIGRAVRIPWPDGVEAQYVTAGPNPDKARITVRRVDGAMFDLTSFTAKLLANAGAGRAIEIVPLLNGQEPLNDPLYFDVSGNYGNEFSYDTSPNHLGTTAALTNYDAYAINLTLDFALTALTLQSTPPETNHPPTDISLASASVLENEPVGTTVGTFSTTDPDAGDAFSYTLVDGVGSNNNGLFAISGNNLLTAASFNYEVQSNYTIRVQSADQGLLFTQKVFAVAVTDMVEPPPVMQPPNVTPDGTIVIRWSSIANHLYTVHASTDLATGFSVLQSNLPATPAVNSYTDSIPIISQKFWKITTGQ
jgi:hypothetical protein